MYPILLQMEERVRELNRKLQEKMRQRVKISSKDNHSNLTVEHSNSRVTSLDNSSKLSAHNIEIRTPDCCMISSDYYSDSGVHTGSVIRSARNSPSENEIQVVINNMLTFLLQSVVPCIVFVCSNIMCMKTFNVNIFVHFLSQYLILPATVHVSKYRRVRFMCLWFVSVSAK